jgi:hypothetical protein
MVAAAIIPNSSIIIKNVGINPTRTGILDVFKQAQINFELLNQKVICNELVADIKVEYTPEIKPFKISGDLVPRLVDEIPVLAVLASQAQSLAQGTASAAALPFPANLAAIASVVAMIVSIFASLPKFAAGGIISGSSHIGDMNLARVNGGEMILNTRQQANLFNMLDKNRLPQSPISSGEVTFRIQGDTLVGVIDNYNRKRSRI